MLRVRVLGELALELDGEPLPPPAGRRLRGLLGWLALHPGLHARGEVAGRLWPDVLDESARGSLRTALAELRRVVGPEHFIATRDAVGFAPEVWVDARVFDALARAGRFEEALALVRGSVLEDLDEEWVHAERDRRREAFRDALAALADRAEAAGDLGAAVGYARRRLAAEPLAEAAHRDLIRRLAAAGDRPAALAAYGQLRELLARELDMTPSEATLRLVQEIRGDEDPPPLPPPLARRHRSPLVGRARTLARLRAAVLDHRMILLAGEPGIGKTRLAAELARSVRTAGMGVLYGRADEEAIAPYQPFAEALRPHATRLRALAGPLGGELGRLVPEVAAQLPAGSTSDPTGARYRLFEAAAAALAGLAEERPLLLVLDDLQWADRPTVLLLRHLARADLGRVAILGTYRERSPELSGLLAELRRDRPAERVALSPLAEADVSELVSAWLGPAAPTALAGPLRSETGGNPFFVEEILRHMWESGAASLEAVGVPASVSEMLAGRLDGLGARARELLTLAAVAGREHNPELLATAADVSREAVVETLDAALAAHLVREEPGRPGRCAFTHALVREAIYDQLSGARRALLHGRIAGALERLDGDPAELARHYLLAGGPSAKVAEHSRRAAAAATARLAYEDAAAHLERALGAGVGGELLAELGEAYLRAGDVEKSRARFSAAAAAARRSGDATLLARAALGRSGLGVVVLGHDPETVALLEEALAALGPNDDALRARLLGRLAIELYHAPPVERREELSAHAVDLARQAGAADALVDALSARHVALWSPPHLDERLRLADEMVAIATAAGDRERVLQGRNWRVLDLLELGDVAAARLEIEQHGALADELRLPGYQWWAPMWRAMLAFLEGRRTESERLRAAAVQIGRRAGDPVAELFNWIQGVFADLESAPLTPQTRTDVPDRVAVQAVESAFRSDLPLIYAEMGRTEEARRELDALTAGGFAAVASDMNWLASMAGLAQGAALLGERERAAELYELLLPYRGRAVLVGRAALCLGPVELQLGILATALDRFDDAADHLDAATAWAEAAGARPWAIWTTVHRAELAATVRDAEAAAAVAGAAAAEADELGFGRAAARARAASHTAARAGST